VKGPGNFIFSSYSAHFDVELLYKPWSTAYRRICNVLNKREKTKKDVKRERERERQRQRERPIDFCSEIL